MTQKYVRALLISSLCGGALSACSSEPTSNASDPRGGKNDEGTASLTFSAEGFRPAKLVGDPTEPLFVGQTLHVFVQATDEPESRLYNAGVIDTMGGFELSFADALQLGKTYRVLAYGDSALLGSASGCQEVDWIRTWSVGPVDGAQHVRLAPDAQGTSDPAADLALCSELLGPSVLRFPLKLVGDGFLEQNQREVLKVSVLPQTERPIPGERLGHADWTGPAVGAIAGPGSIRFTDRTAFAQDRRERILLYLEADGVEGCTEGDFFGAPFFDSVLSTVELTFGPTNFPKSDDPADDLELCSKFHPNGANPRGDFASTYEGTGFTALAGKPIVMAVFRGFGEATTRITRGSVAADGSFTMTMPEAAPTLGVLGNLLLLDADGDGRCASPDDAVIGYVSGFAVRDQIVRVNPMDGLVNGETGIPREELCDRVFGTAR
jgi:hypothetical protein